MNELILFLRPLQINDFAILEAMGKAT